MLKSIVVVVVVLCVCFNLHISTLWSHFYLNTTHTHLLKPTRKIEMQSDAIQFNYIKIKKYLLIISEMVSPASNELFQFLQKYQVPKGSEFTHSSMGNPPGLYLIDSKDKDQLIDLLYEAIFRSGANVHLTEKPEQHTIIKADLDFKFDFEEDERKYTLDHIQGMVALYHKAITTYLEVAPEQLKAFVLERDKPYKYKGNCKDGIHLMYPYIVCDTEIQHLIRNQVLTGAQSILSSLPCKNGIEDIVDKSIISTNNWLMYRCSKPYAKPYCLTHIFDHELNDLNRDKYKDKKALIRLLSIRDHPLNESIPIKSEHRALLEKKKPTIAKAIKGSKSPN